GGRPVHDPDDRAPRAGARDGGARAGAHPESPDPDALRADHQRTGGRDPYDAAVAPGPEPASARARSCVGSRPRSHARHAHAGADAVARRGVRRGLRSPPADVHDPAPCGSGNDGRRAVSHGRRRTGRRGLKVRLGCPGRSADGDRAHGADARTAPLRSVAARTTHDAGEPVMSTLRSKLADARRIGGKGLILSTLLAMGACASAGTEATPAPTPAPAPTPTPGSGPPVPDPRIGLAPGLLDAGEAIWNLRLVSSTPPPPEFVGVTNSDLAFIGDYVIQGNYNGYQVWDISNPAQPTLVTGYVCPASQSDVPEYRNLVFVSGEGLSGRLDCGTQGVSEAVSTDRLRGLRIFDISDIRNPVNVGNVQTCRGSHTHTVLVDPDDDENVYVYISGSSSVRPEEELPGCSDAPPSEDPNTALFRIEVIRVPLADPSQAEIVSSPRIFEGLT